MKISHKGFIAPLLLALIAALLIGGGVYMYVQNKQTNQSSAVQMENWKTYSNDELGISFLYPDPDNSTDTGKWRTSTGDTGKSFGGQIVSFVAQTNPDYTGKEINIAATTKDYTLPKEGSNFGTEGFEIKDGQYYAIVGGKVSNTPFVPDEVWKLENGSSVPVIYGKKYITYGENYDAYVDGFPEPYVSAIVNIPGKNFTGIEFVLWNMDETGTHPATPAEMAVFKKIVTSISMLQTPTSQTAPTVSLTANPTSITVGQATTLTASSTNARGCVGTGTDGSKFYGTGAVFPTKTTTYTYTCYESSDQTGKSGSASITVNVSPAPTSTASPYINKVTTDVGMDGPVMYISGIGFSTSSIVHISGNGVGISLSPAAYAAENGSDGKNIGLSLPGNIDINKQYSVYVSNGSAISNTVLVAVPNRG